MVIVPYVLPPIFKTMQWQKEGICFFCVPPNYQNPNVAIYQKKTHILLLNKMKPFSVMLPVFSFIYLHLLLLFTLNFSWFGLNSLAFALGNKTDHLALLKFKESISKDPYGILESWNSSTHFCKWHGITCNHMHRRVAELSITGYKLHGSISPHVGNLSFLTYLNLENNSFYGEIPQELGHLLQLEFLYLNNNSLVGEIPTNLTSCSKLNSFDVSVNNLVGKIPIKIGSLQKLQQLHIGKNKLTGQIPASIGNLSSLILLEVGYNNLEGNIPQEIERLKNLTKISVHMNKLSGMLLSYLYNISSLITISAADNQFNGSLLPNMFHTLPNLKFLEIAGNQISGPIPISITNASFLQIIDLADNYFEGQAPILGKLPNIWAIVLSNNNIGSNSSKDFEFLESLTNCSKLYGIGITSSNFGGRLPNSLGNLSTQFGRLYLGGNHFNGKIPPELGSLTNLIILALEANHFEGIIPITLRKLQKIQILNVHGNKLSGDIPPFIGNLSQLFELDLSQNMFEGNIPPSIGNSQKLGYLSVAQNKLRGTIPSEVFNIFSLTILLDLSGNSFSGNLPNEVGKLKNINKLDVSKNHLSGDIPGTIGECISLEYLYLQGNSFSGIIPSSLDSLKGLRHLDLSRNCLSGSIPKGLQNISFLEYLNMSFNMLDGEVPTKGVFQNSSRLAVIGNNKLCGGIAELHLPPCLVNVKLAKHHNYRRLIALVVCLVAFLLVLSFILTIYWMSKRTKKSSSYSPTTDQLAKVSYQNLYCGTDEFSARNLIGSGSFSSVYKGTLGSEGKIVAIKVLDLQKKGAHKSFIAECNALKNIRHRNLVKVLTCCSSIDYKGQEFKALVFEYMTNGSLESWLHPGTEIAGQPRSLNLGQRLNIIVDIASAFHYLHYEYEEAIIHCDLKPSNILLDDCMVAYVTDFGLARFLSCIGDSLKQTSTIGIKGTIGYTPPEYGMGSKVSIEGDMYSFGILVLEMLTGRRPTDERFKDRQNLHNYVKASIPNHLLQIVDPTIFPMGIEQLANNENLNLMHPNAKKCLLSLFRIALACSMESPQERMNMLDVTRELKLIQSFFPSSGINDS